MRCVVGGVGTGMTRHPVMDSRKRTLIARTVACLMIRAAYARIQSGESFVDKLPHIEIPDEAWWPLKPWHGLWLAPPVIERLEAYGRIAQEWKGW